MKNQNDIIYCKNCLMPSSRPRIIFNEGICNGCRNKLDKKKTNWEQRRQEFLEEIEPYKNMKNKYSCIVPWSGGKDSTMIALKLKLEFGLNPLLVTFAPVIPTEIGIHNRKQIIDLGFDHIYVNPNRAVARELCKRFLEERGDPKIAWSAGVTATPVNLATKMGIPLIFYAEHGESEYGGHVLSEKHKKERDVNEFLEHLVGDDPMNWVNEDTINDSDILPYTFPDAEAVKKNGVRPVYFSYFFKWDVYENFKYVKNKINFKTALNGRTDGTFTNYDSLDDKIDDIYYYFQYIKFGFGRALRDASRLLNLGYINQKKAIEYIKKYDHEFPTTYFHEVKKYLKVNDKYINSIIDRHRNKEIWRNKNGKWELSSKIND